MGVDLDLSVTTEAGGLGPESFWCHGCTRDNDSILVSMGADERGSEMKRWAQRYLQATEMLPRVIVKQALMQACRLWTRVFPPGTLPNTLTPTNCRRLQECSQLAISALLLLGRPFCCLRSY